MTNPFGVNVLSVQYPAWPTCNIGTFVRMNALSHSDPTSSWEYRRKNTPQEDGRICGANGWEEDTSLPPNPCSPSPGGRSIAVLNRMQPKLNASGNPTPCTVDSDCNDAQNYLCSSEGMCVRFRCQTFTALRPDEVEGMRDNCPTGAGPDACPTRSLDWIQVPTSVPTGAVTQYLRRLRSRVSETGLRTSYEHDDQGRVIAECVGDTDNIVDDATPASCPTTGRFRRWTYDVNHPITPWAIAKIEERSVLNATAAVLPSTTYERDTATGAVIRVTDARYTYTTLGGAVALQTRVTEYDYDAQTGAVTSVYGPAAATTVRDASSPRRVTEYYAATGSTADYQVNTVDVRATSETAQGGPQNLRTQYANYTNRGLPLTIVSPDGVTTTRTVDAAGRLTSVTVAGRTTTVQYDTQGRTRAMMLPTGDTYVYEYSGNETTPYRTLRTDDALFDENGNFAGATTGDYVEDNAFRPGISTSQRRLGRLGGTPWFDERRGYDDHSRLLYIEPVGGSGQRTPYEYDPVKGYLVKITNPLQHETRYERDAFGRVTRVARLSGTTELAATSYCCRQ